MNVAQLAVYQLPSEMHTMQKRTTIPFYNRRRALKQQEAPHNSTVITNTTRVSPWEWLTSLTKRTYNTTVSCIPTTVTSTRTVTTECHSTNAPPSTPDTTYIGPPLPCLPTASQVSDCTCSNDPGDDNAGLDPVLQRPNGQAFVSPTPEPVQGTSQALKRQAAGWNRVAYYTSSAPAQATGLSFMANLGDPDKSGTFD